MKNFCGILSSLLSVSSAICLLFFPSVTGYISGFVLMLFAIVIFLFMIVEEQKSTISNLRDIISKNYKSF